MNMVRSQQICILNENFNWFRGFAVQTVWTLTQFVLITSYLCKNKRCMPARMNFYKNIHCKTTRSYQSLHHKPVLWCADFWTFARWKRMQTFVESWWIFFLSLILIKRDYFNHFYGWKQIKNQHFIKPNWIMTT